MPDLPIRSETIPEGSCPATYNELAQLFASHFFAVQAAGVGKLWIFSTTKPTLDQAEDYGWYQLDEQGFPIRTYVFANGFWLSKHPILPGQTVWSFQNIADILSYDGGDGSSGPVTSNTGPMWQYARVGNLNNLDDGTIIKAQFPLVSGPDGVGILPNGTTINTGDEGGTDQVTLDLENTPKHSHLITRPTRQDTGTPSWESGVGEDFSAPTSEVGGRPDGTTKPFSILPPYVVGILIQRTNRTHYAIVG